jgi:hypothetical protein
VPVSSGLPDLAGYVEHFRMRVVQDALAEATATYWHRRAAAFENAMPKPDDFTGNATAEDVEAQRWRIAATELACRQRAAVSLLGGRA